MNTRQNLKKTQWNDLPNRLDEMFRRLCEMEEGGTIATWDPTVEYSAGDLVIADNTLYQAITDNTNLDPTANPDEWQVIGSSSDLDVEIGPNENWFINGVDTGKPSRGTSATITTATATVSNTTGTPSVTVTPGGTEMARTFAFNFSNLKGDTGAQGSNGTSATITGASATVNATVGTPAVTVTPGGTASARTFAFAFSNLKGETGTAATITGASATVLAEGATPTVTLGGTASARTFQFGIPKGDTGSVGPAGTITSATAVSLAAGATPTITLGGTASARTMQFGIPKGDTGATPTMKTMTGITMTGTGDAVPQYVKDNGGTNIKFHSCTQAQFDAIASKDPLTFYIIIT